MRGSIDSGWPSMSAGRARSPTSRRPWPRRTCSISTSDYEGLSLAQLEALAAGVPVVATDAGGVGELAPGDPAVAVLPRDAEPDSSRRCWPTARPHRIPATLPAHFTRGTMAARYTWLYAAGPRRRAATGGDGDGLVLITNNLSLGGAQTSARRLLTGMAARGVRTSVRSCSRKSPTTPRPADEP